MSKNNGKEDHDKYEKTPEFMMPAIVGSIMYVLVLIIALPILISIVNALISPVISATLCAAFNGAFGSFFKDKNYSGANIFFNFIIDKRIRK